jgi:hypothetical protein
MLKTLPLALIVPTALIVVAVVGLHMGKHPDQKASIYGKSPDEQIMSKSMKLSEYFEKTQGIGVLATTDTAGQVNQAIYSQPHFLDDDDDETCSFIMSDRLSHDNVKHNPSASYLFIKEGDGYVGKRLSLTVIEEETDPEKIKAVRHRNIPTISEEEGKYLVRFHIDGVRSLSGNEYL